MRANSNVTLMQFLRIFLSVKKNQIESGLRSLPESRILRKMSPNKKPGADAEKIAVFRKDLGNLKYSGGAAQA